MNWLKHKLRKLLIICYNFLLIIDVQFIKKNKSTIVLDIDNTLADTWPTLKNENINNFSNEKHRISSLNLINGAFDLVKYSSKKFDQIIFLSARNPAHYFITKKWIDSNFKKISYKLRLVPNVNLKQIYWEKIIKISNETVIIDDLSYNHENNDTKFYNNEINYLQSNSSIKYFGYADICDGLSNIQNKI
ncbi:hypothetical protein FORMA_16060 [Formosa sp. Hel3_A1_48]|uniref:hypothetical protein n=1 Tax=Formosa sp. Hel3_A1_48 TaxID=1336795 RepID=UPI00084E2285|nr:hypothetical protein [Formosa sp. Hel3_A1_48]AOR26756.1 hypothetical protein FORMA_16060 [Formosa sp. Hel3_A1_48]